MAIDSKTIDWLTTRRRSGRSPISASPRPHGALNHSKLDRSDRMTMKAAGAAEGDFGIGTPSPPGSMASLPQFGRPPEAR
jgi:hypothetical protein